MHRNKKRFERKSSKLHKLHLNKSLKVELRAEKKTKVFLVSFENFHLNARASSVSTLSNPETKTL